MGNAGTTTAYGRANPGTIIYDPQASDAIFADRVERDERALSVRDVDSLTIFTNTRRGSCAPLEHRLSKHLEF